MLQNVNMENLAKEMILSDRVDNFESNKSYYLCSFSYLRENKKAEKSLRKMSKVYLYIEKEHFYVITENDDVYHELQTPFQDIEMQNQPVYHFFMYILKKDMEELQVLEDNIIKTEDDAIKHKQEDYIKIIAHYKRRLLHLKKYYEHLSIIMDGLLANDQNILSEEEVKNLVIIDTRIDRLLNNLMNLREYVKEMRESVQAEMDIQQNNLMRAFTVISAIFLPLSLIVGWYGMNFQNMPELMWQHGYLYVILLSIAVFITLYLIFRKKKWL